MLLPLGSVDRVFHRFASRIQSAETWNGLETVTDGEICIGDAMPVWPAKYPSALLYRRSIWSACTVYLLITVYKKKRK